jgi:hypothetical protein
MALVVLPKVALISLNGIAQIYRFSVPLEFWDSEPRRDAGVTRQMASIFELLDKTISHPKDYESPEVAIAS